MSRVGFSRTMKVLISILIGLVLVGCGKMEAKAEVHKAANGAEWLYHKDVRYQKNSDPSVVWLDTGERVKVKYSNIKWKEVDKWNKGRQLHIAYMPSTGPVLLDPKTRKVIPILSGLKEHPIDALLDRRLQIAQSTVSMVECYVGITELWDHELNRAYRLVLADKEDHKLNAEEKLILVGAQRKWVDFRDAQIRAIGTHYGKRDGTIRGIIAASQVMDVTKQQALRLGSMFGF